MSWYYAIRDQKHGPITATQMTELSRAGTLTSGDLVWREGIADWLPLHQAADQIYTESAAIETGAVGGDVAPVETATCAFSDRMLPKTELVPYGDRWIDPQHKDDFIQRLMETGETSLESATEHAAIPVGFWWRVLGAFIDYFVVIIPAMLFMVPYYITSAGHAVSTNPENPFNGWTLAMGLTYAFGALGSNGVVAVYHTWMLGKYRATVGKMAIGAIVVSPDGSQLSYGRSFCRWLTHAFVNGIILALCVGISFGLGVALMAGIGISVGDDNPGAMISGIVVMFGMIVGGFLVGMFPYWMAAFDVEKRTLHDRICSTRVIKKL